MSDNVTSAFIKLSDGNPGAMTALMDVYRSVEQVDPYAVMGIITYILHIDRLEIYGTDIYVLWNDICDRDASKTIAVLKANTLDLISDQDLKDACHRQDRKGSEMVPVEELYSKVVEKYPNFDFPHRMNKETIGCLMKTTWRKVLGPIEAPLESKRLFEAYWIDDTYQIEGILEQGFAGMFADENKRITLWKDDNGRIRGVLERFNGINVSLKVRTFSDYQEAVKAFIEWKKTFRVKVS